MLHYRFVNEFYVPNCFYDIIFISNFLPTAFIRLCSKLNTCQYIIIIGTLYYILYFPRVFLPLFYHFSYFLLIETLSVLIASALFQFRSNINSFTAQSQYNTCCNYGWVVNYTENVCNFFVAVRIYRVVKRISC